MRKLWFPMTVASYNITGQNTSGDTRLWSERRQEVARFIVDCLPGVAGLQEASAGWLAGTTRDNPQTQYDDLLTLVNAKLSQSGYADHFAVTNVVRNNCGLISDRSRCIQDTDDSDGIGGPNDTRIIYNTAKVRIADGRQGYAYLLSTNKTTKARLVSWAWFQDLTTGRRFFLADTHLERNATNGYRRAEMKTLLDAIKGQNTPNYPMVLIGDLNSSRYELANTAADMPPVSSMRLAEILGHDRTIYRSSSGKHRGSCKVKTATYRVPFTAAARKFPAYNTYNASLYNNCRWKPSTLPKYKWWIVNGIALDYIFTSRDLVRPKVWETKANVDGLGGYRGDPPSDHNMIMATLVLLK